MKKNFTTKIFASIKRGNECVITPHFAIRHSIVLLFSFILLLPTAAFSQSWLWAKSAGGSDRDMGYNITTDATGNVFVTGSFESSSVTFGTTTLTNAHADSADIFLVKYDPSGNVLWAKSAGGSASDIGNSVTTDATGNVFVTGYFKSSTITFGTYTLTNSGDGDIFLVKYDPSGNVLWAKSAGGSASDLGNSVTTDATGNVFITGYFESSSITFGTYTLTNASGGYEEIFLVKYDPSGNVLWAKSADGTNEDWGNWGTSVTTDASGNVFVTGYFTSSSITFGTYTLTNAYGGYEEIFLVKYDPSGNVLWAKSGGGTNEDWGTSVTTDASGNVFVTGWFMSSSITFGIYTLINSGNRNIFLVKYDPNGNVLWAKSAGGTDYDAGGSVTTDASGNVFVTGVFGSSPMTFGTYTLTKVGGSDIFLVKYDPNGNVLWAKSAGGTNEDWGNSVTTDATGSVFVTGSFESSSVTFGTYTLTNAGDGDIFVAKFGTSTGIEEIPAENNINIFPNPASDYIYINSTFFDGSGMWEYQIYDILGNCVQSGTIESNKINISQLSSGFYTVRFFNGGKQVIEKLMKE